jgi:hypothetical protein
MLPRVKTPLTCKSKIVARSRAHRGDTAGNHYAPSHSLLHISRMAVSIQPIDSRTDTQVSIFRATRTQSLAMGFSLVRPSAFYPRAVV